MLKALAIASGKGGVGKTTIAVNLALTQAIKEKCLLLDADMGMANAHILLGLNPEITVREVIEGKASLEQAIVKAPNELNFLSGGSGITELLSIDSEKKFNFIRSFNSLSSSIPNLIIDVSAGADNTALNMISAADKVLIVLLNEPTSFMDAFTLIKACHLEFGYKEFCVTINMANSEIQAKQDFARFKKIITNFYDINLTYVGYIQSRNIIKQSIVKRRPVVLDNKNSDIINAFKNIYANILTTKINYHSGIKFFYKNKVEKTREA